MKTNKFLAILALVLPLVFVSCSSDDDEEASAETGKYDFKKDGVYYNIVSETNRTVEVTDNESGFNATTSGYASYSGSVTIPTTVTHNGVTYTVVGIKDYAFGDSGNLTSVAIPNSVTYIGEAAFNTTGLTSVTIPNSVEIIGLQAFYNCTSLSSVSLSNSLTILEDGIFMSCSSLNSISIPNSVKSIGFSAFYGCSSLTSVSIPNSVTNIDDNAFLDCISLKDVTIPNSVTTLGAFCFAGCSALKEVIMGNSLDKIEEGTFEYCNSLNKITSLNPTPPSCNDYSFYRIGDENIDIYNSIVYVPAGSKEAYSTAYVWSNFSNIVEIE